MKSWEKTGQGGSQQYDDVNYMFDDYINVISKIRSIRLARMDFHKKAPEDEARAISK